MGQTSNTLFKSNSTTISKLLNKPGKKSPSPNPTQPLKQTKTMPKQTPQDAVDDLDDEDDISEQPNVAQKMGNQTAAEKIVTSSI